METGGRGKGVDPLEIRTADMTEELLIEVRNSQGVIASGALSASELWKVPHLTLPHQLDESLVQKLWCRMKADSAACWVAQLLMHESNLACLRWSRFS